MLGSFSGLKSLRNQKKNRERKNISILRRKKKCVDTESHVDQRGVLWNWSKLVKGPLEQKKLKLIIFFHDGIKSETQTLSEKRRILCLVSLN